ncbi:hypothetical protein niasHT_037506 [Heterodera trifolii]|uniref:Uncharacterized protein n=1 Tax=Heterodera trifolii TaxID=157864 RepID=A0ABD2IXW5_9BILA
MFSAVIALIVHHQTVLLNAESNSTSKEGQNEANGTALFKKINATDKKDEGQKVLLLLKQKQRQHFGEGKTVDWSSNSTSSSSSNASSVPFSETKKANRGNNCTTPTAHFGQKNSTKIDKQKREKRRKREADSTTSVEHFSTENGEEKDESGRLSSETSSGAEEKEEAKKNSSEANGERKGKERDETEGGGRRGGGEEEEEEDNEEEKGENSTNCGNELGELLLKMAQKEGKVADAIVKSVKNGSEETPKGTKLATETEKSSGTVENEANYGGRNQTVATEKGNGTVENGTNERRRKRENTQDLVRQANAQLQNSFGNAQTMVQQQQQMPAQIIQLPSMDLSNGKAQNVLLISDSGNVSMSRGLHFLSVSTSLQQ